MIKKEINLKFTKRQVSTKLAVTACWHVGNPNCKEETIERLMEKCNEEKMPWIHLGDIIEAISPTDPRFHCETHEKSILAQTAEAASYVARAKKHLIGMILGNHEEKIDRVIGSTVQDILSRVFHSSPKAGSLNLGGMAYIDFICPEGTARGLFSHSRFSSGIGRSTYEPYETTQKKKQDKIRNLLKYWTADFKCVAHGHTEIIAPPVTRPTLAVVDGKSEMVEVVERPEWCAMCPSMFGNYDVSGRYPSYAEMAMYPPTDIGWLEVVLDRTGKVQEIKGEK